MKENTESNIYFFFRSIKITKYSRNKILLRTKRYKIFLWRSWEMRLPLVIRPGKVTSIMQTRKTRVHVKRKKREKERNDTFRNKFLSVFSRYFCSPNVFSIIHSPLPSSPGLTPRLCLPNKFRLFLHTEHQPTDCPHSAMGASRLMGQGRAPSSIFLNPLNRLNIDGSRHLVLLLSFRNEI